MRRLSLATLRIEVSSSNHELKEVIILRGIVENVPSLAMVSARTSEPNEVERKSHVFGHFVIGDGDAVKLVEKVENTSE